MSYIYLYGMILASHSFMFDEFLTPDHYSEYSAHNVFVGGETGVCATILSGLGENVLLDGNHIGRNVAPLLKDFFSDRTVDLSPLTFDYDYDGLEDYILVSGDIRTPFGMFGRYFEEGVTGGIRHWNEPKEEHIANCDVAAIDPFFRKQSEEAAKMCISHGKKYVTIDCEYDSFMHRNSAVNVISGEFIRTHYNGSNSSELIEHYIQNSDGLTIITSGSGDILYGRKGKPIKSFTPFRVDVISTLGAGDSFKAGCTYALSKGFDDGKLVEFASAVSGCAISRYTMQANPPTLEDVKRLIESRK